MLLSQKLRIFILFGLIFIGTLTSCLTGPPKELGSGGEPYKIENFYDLSVKPEGVLPEHEYLFDQVTVDYPTEKVKIWWGWTYYLGHPDFLQLDNGDILCAYPKGHGKGETILKRSSDLGLTWSDRVKGLPENFKDTDETPTLYKLNFQNGEQKLVMISARPGWGKKAYADGFDATLSLSKDENGSSDGKVWLPYENFYGRNAIRSEFLNTDGDFAAIVAMASLTQIKDTKGVFQDKWMGIFHDYTANVYKSYLTFNAKGQMLWSFPTRVIDSKYRSIEENLFFCEPEVIRSPKGNEIAMLFRTNAKTSLSHIIFSTDEGETWSEPQPLSRELTGERHKAEYCPVTNKLIITFRSIHWPTDKSIELKHFYSLGWLAWVGDYEDLKKGEDAKGDFVLKLAHTYLEEQTNPDFYAHADTGYAGLIIDESGMAVTASYGRFSPATTDTYVVSKQFKIKDILDVFEK